MSDRIAEIWERWFGDDPERRWWGVAKDDIAYLLQELDRVTEERDDALTEAATQKDLADEAYAAMKAVTEERDLRDEQAKDRYRDRNRARNEARRLEGELSAAQEREKVLREALERIAALPEKWDAYADEVLRGDGNKRDQNRQVHALADELRTALSPTEEVT